MFQVAWLQEGARDRDNLLEGKERRRAAEADGCEAEGGGEVSQGRRGGGARGSLGPSAEGAPPKLQGCGPLRR